MRAGLCLLLVPVASFSLTYHTVTVDASLAEWNLAEERWTTSTPGVFGFITWDSRYVFVGYQGVYVTDHGGYNQAVFVALDSDPMPDFSGGGSTTLPYEQWFSGSAVHLPFKADLLYSVKAFAGAPEPHVWVWADSGWHRDGQGGTPDLRPGVLVAWQGGVLEMAIPRSHLGNPSHIHMVMYAKDLASASNPGWGWLYGAVPDNGTTDGINDKTFSHFYGFRLGPGLRPNDGVFYDAAQGKVFWWGDPPGPNDTLGIVVRQCTQGGRLHWGVNSQEGSWTQPIQRYWPPQTVPWGTDAVETPLLGPDSQGVCRVSIGPFNTGAQLVWTVDFVIHWNDGTWDNNGGRDWQAALWLQPVGPPSVQLQGLPPDTALVQGDTLQIAWASSGAVAETLWVDGTWRATSPPYWWDTSTQSLGRHLVVAQAVDSQGRAAFDWRWVWVTPQVEQEPPPPGATPGAHDNGDGTVTFLLWAPGKRFVTLWGDFTNWETGTVLKAWADSVWWTTIPLSPGSYRYRFLVDGLLPIADPYARRVDWVHNGLPSGDWRIAKAVVDVGAQPFPWTDATWVRPAPDQMIIYEVHVGDFSPTRDFNGVRARLPYLRTLGVNALELMPCYEFPGAVSWGYNPAFFMAPEASYGSPDELKALVDEAHAQGMAVILDMVFNHMDASSPLYRLYGTDWDASPWFHAMTNPWGFPDLDHWSQGTKQLTRDVLYFWMDEYHVDGFRYDATAFIGWDGVGDSTGNGIGYFTYVAWAHDPQVYQVLEHLPQDPAVVIGTRANSGWHDTFHDQMKANLREGPFEGCSYGNMNVTAQAIHFAGDGFTHHTQVVNYTESHDEQRVIWEAQTNPTIDYALAVKKSALGACVLFTATGIPMLYQGQEFGEDSPRTIDPNPLHWEYLESPSGASLFQHYRRLIWLRTNYPSLRSGNLFTVHQDNSHHTIGYWRWADDGTDSVVVVANFDRLPKTVATPFPVSGTWYEFLGDSTVQIASSPRLLTIPGSEARIFCRVKRWSWDLVAPAPPSGLVVEPTGSGLLLTWRPVVADANGGPETPAFYQVFRASAPYFQPGPASLLATTSDTTYVDQAPLPSACYYRVRAWDTSGNQGSPSAAVGRVVFPLLSLAGTAAAHDPFARATSPGPIPWTR